ncbi:MAG: glycosyltransferase family 9 protein, partial [Proteobacteria bacterium]|nr:glycosyltransferase family 9 protein [Pseudomonadota bacterium]
ECVLIHKGKGLRKLFTVYGSANQISQKKLDVLLVPHRSTTSAFIAKLSGVKKIIGHKDASCAWIYSETRYRQKTQHEAIRCLNLAPEWLLPRDIGDELRLSGRPILNARGPLDKLWVSFPHIKCMNFPYFVVSPGSVWGTKIYPPQHYAHIAAGLLARDSALFCFVTGSPADKASIDKFIAQIPLNLKHRVVNAIGLLALSELITLIAGAKILLTNDSAPVHIASGTNTLTLAIFGPTIRENGFWPLASGSKLINYSTEHGSALPCQPCGIHGPQVCPLTHHHCMRHLSPGFVLNEASILLGSQQNNFSGEA